MYHDVYICYAQQDREIAEEVCRYLESNHIRCWIAPRDITSDEDFKKQIKDAIDRSKGFVLIFSGHSNENSYVITEVDYAFSRQIPTVAYMVGKASPEGALDFFLKGCQWIDASSNPHDHLDVLVHILDRTEGIAKPQVFPVGIVKHKASVISKPKSEDSYIYLSYDEKDSEIIEMEIEQYRHQKIDFIYQNPYKIANCALLVAFISRNSNDSSDIKDDIIKAISANRRILLIYLDDSEISFGAMFRLRYSSKFKSAVAYSIHRHALSALDYKNKCIEIYELFGIRPKVSRDSFTYLDNLIRDNKEVVLEDDFTLNDDEIFLNGIELKRDNVIDAQGHKITASAINQIFRVTSDVTIMNMDFSSLSDVTSAILVEKGGSLTLKGCRFTSCDVRNAVENMGSLEVSESNFEAINGFSIFSSGKAVIIDTLFTGSESDGRTVLHNDGIMQVASTTFSHNRMTCVYNRGELLLKDVGFTDNVSSDGPCAVSNDGKATCAVTRFSNHQADSAIIENRNDFEIVKCMFKDNFTSVILSNSGGFIRSFDCEFSQNAIKKAAAFNGEGEFRLYGAVFESNLLEDDAYELHNMDYMDLRKVRLEHVKVYNGGDLHSDRPLDGVTVVSMTTGIDKPFKLPEGSLKAPNHSIISVSFDEMDLEFIEMQLSQYESMGIDYSIGDSHIEDSSLLVCFVSKKSRKSKVIKSNIENALLCNVDVLLIRLDDVASDFEDHAKFSIDRFDLSEIEYIRNYREILNLYNVKVRDMEENAPEESQIPAFNVGNAQTFTDLENMIANSDEITLENDIHLAGGEGFESGIAISRDNIIIDGNGHSIHANGISRIFTVTSKNVTFKNIIFKYCRLKDTSAIIEAAEDSRIRIDSCTFESNSLDDGHAIFSLGSVSIISSKFTDNRSKNEGPAIYSRKGTLNVRWCEFTENKSHNSGGAILNWAKLTVTESLFRNNYAEGYGGAIGNVIDASLKVTSTHFISNHAVSDACAIYNENTASCYGCKFTDNKSNSNLLFSESRLNLYDCSFKNNSCEILVQNNENGVLFVTNSKFKNNITALAGIYNNGEVATLEKVKFDSETINIYNDSYMRLKQPIADGETILNNGHMDVWRMDTKAIKNKGIISVMDGPCDKRFIFSDLANVLDNLEGDTLVLSNDIMLDNCELDFYEGGIEIDRDNLIIDGAGHSIDGANRSAIFYVTAKNVTLKNIVFKNANLVNNLTPHTTGGSAIRTVAGSSLKVENCEFTHNCCDDDGGAILNRGEMHLAGSGFENNTSKYYGGAICNRGILHLKTNRFADNTSRIDRDIFNGFIIDGEYEKASVYDVGESLRPFEPFSYLANKLTQSNNVILDCDIRYDYGKDKDHKDGILIENIEYLTIDGRGFAIDGDDRSSIFKIMNSNVIFMNMTFKNAFGDDSPIFEINGKVRFVSCSFIHNHASFDESMIENKGNVELVDCRFINNLSKNRSLIKNSNRMSAESCTFSLNSVQKSTIANEGMFSISSSRFDNNHSQENAGAISNMKKGELYVESTVFDANSTSGSGGAIINFGALKARKCEFIKNSSEGDGGAINNESDARLRILDSVFSQNSSKGDGGVMINWGELYFESCRFTSNRARKDGGVVNVQKGLLEIDTCEFTKNRAFDGGAIFNRGRLDIADVRFTDNHAKSDGGVINSYDGDMSIIKALFDENTASDGGVIYSRKGKIYISDCQFSKNAAQINGGSIINWCEMVIEKSVFDGNSAVIYGGAINNQKELLTVTNSRFYQNRADVGGAIFSVDENKLDVRDCEFEDNSPDDVY